MATFKGNEGQDITYSAMAAEAGIVAAVMDLMKVISIATKNTLTVTHNADGTYAVAFTLV